MTKLSVNINKVATIRNARGGNNPDVIQVAKDAQAFGAQGITVHPRPDERHIRYADVYALREVVHTEFNIEGYPSEDFIRLVSEVRPEQVTLVPDPPGVLTSNAGWRVRENFDFLKKVLEHFHDKGIRTSIFIDTDLTNIRDAAEVGANRVELYTEPYAQMYHQDRNLAVAPFVKAGRYAKECGSDSMPAMTWILTTLSFYTTVCPNLMRFPSVMHLSVMPCIWDWRRRYESIARSWDTKDFDVISG